MEFLTGLAYALGMIVIGLAYAFALTVGIPIAIFVMMAAIGLTFSSRWAFLGIVSVLLAIWLSGIEPLSGFAWGVLVYAAFSVSIVGGLLGVLFGLVWVWENSLIGRAAIFGSLCIFGGLWVIALVAGGFQPDPHGCDAPMMARFVC